MRKGTGDQENSRRMRQEAERNVPIPAQNENGTILEIDRINHELRVHQIELEMQNEELRRSHHELEVSRDRYHDLYDFAPVGFFTLDEELKIMDVNLTGATLLGRSRPELEGKSFRDYINIADIHIWRHHVAVVQQGNENGDCEIVLDLPNGRTVHAYLHSINVEMGGEAPMFRMAISDIGDRWLAEKKAKDKEHKLQMLAAITRHDLSNQIMVLKGCQDLAEMAKDPDSAREFRRKGANATKNIESIINFTIQYQELGERSPEWIEIRSAVDRSCSELALNNLEFRNELDTVYVLADPMIGKVFYNLVENSIRHAKGATFVRFRSYVEMGRLLMVYEDDGIGIGSEVKEKIFERGYGGHTGLGLFFAREILAITNISIVERGYQGDGVKFVISVLENNWRETLKPSSPNLPG